MSNLSRHEARKRLQSLVAGKKMDPTASENKIDTRKRGKNVSEMLLRSLEEAHQLREHREELGYDAELTIQALHKRLNRVYLALTEGGKPSDYEPDTDNS